MLVLTSGVRALLAALFVVAVGAAVVMEVKRLFPGAVFGTTGQTFIVPGMLKLPFGRPCVFTLELHHLAVRAQENQIERVSDGHCLNPPDSRFAAS